MHIAPGPRRLRSYDRRDLRGDIIGGITVTAYLVPQVMAYSTLAGLPATSGLWVVIVGFVIYAFVGSSRLLSVGPESSTALLTATALAPLAGGDPLRYAALAAALALIVGCLALLAAVLRLGFVGDLLGKPLLIGYMAGVAVLMISSQVMSLTQTPGNPMTFAEEVLAIIRNVQVSSFAWAPLIMATAIAGALVLLGTRMHSVPWPLILVSGAALLTAALPSAASALPTVGSIPVEVPRSGSPLSLPRTSESWHSPRSASWWSATRTTCSPAACWRSVPATGCIRIRSSLRWEQRMWGHRSWVGFQFLPPPVAR